MKPSSGDVGIHHAGDGRRLYEDSLLPDWFQNEETWHVGVGNKLASKYQTVIIVSTAMYLPVLWAVHQFMKNRKPQSMAAFTFMWNLNLSLLSLLGFGVMVLGESSLLFRLSVPQATFYPSTRAAITTFALTKVLEFGDTILLILKKKPLSFLHVYHHIVTALFCLHSQLVEASFGHFFAIFNLGIHSIMYFYYAMCTLLSALPANKESESATRSPIMAFRYVLKIALQVTRPYITLSQVCQMFAGLGLSVNAALSNSTPEWELPNAYLATLMYGSFAYLFTHFFVVSFLIPKRKVDTPDTTNDEKQTHTPVEGRPAFPSSSLLAQGLVQRNKLSDRQTTGQSVEKSRLRTAG
eukprot:GHVS01093375.1.p1 GENE.GHVS01093375.1~~GHVS01093375.1.p1  ORF type:complete len:353 (+),score=35.68 GHVS01093375.1:161-1219(+)